MGLIMTFSVHKPDFRPPSTSGDRVCRKQPMYDRAVDSIGLDRIFEEETEKFDCESDWCAGASF